MVAKRAETGGATSPASEGYETGSAAYAPMLYPIRYVRAAYICLMLCICLCWELCYCGIVSIYWEGLVGWLKWIVDLD